MEIIDEEFEFEYDEWMRSREGRVWLEGVLARIEDVLASYESLSDSIPFENKEDGVDS